MREWRMATIMTAVVTVLVASTFAAPIDRLEVIVNGIVVPAFRVSAVHVEQDPLQPDMALVTLTPPPWLVLQAGANLEVTGGGIRIFKGEVVTIEPLFDAGRGAVTLRAFNRLHRLARERKTRVFEDKTDSQIVSSVAAEYGLAGVAEGDAAQVTHARVFQHNQTDLEFLLERAALISYEVFVEDTKLLKFRPRQDPNKVALGCPARLQPWAVELRAFRVRLARPEQVQRVIVHGWDPEWGEEIVGSAQGKTIDLAGTPGSLPGLIGRTVDLGRIEALTSATGAHGAAAGTLAAMTASDVAAEADVDGTPLLKAGTLVTVVGRDAAFNGKYLVAGATHRYSKDGSAHPYHTLLRLARQDSGMYYFLPEVGDEVLVAFIHGDVAQPVVLGSLWNDPARPEERLCEPR
jgi:phage protein D